ncbi:a49-like RNA polymerase I associated factor domain-containing protein [Ditylenchus destructor]|uniref:A49-like RNA polymerase I associated factor domain-containing protein n=1 Tax=Ditylenchus destructor TaxID=166010 RepID=A0AAD4N4U5_9BILA|nr:a49-like RNA polymerase I associated factor domain-containing protein [Ditylenchus destructor]
MNSDHRDRLKMYRTGGRSENIIAILNHSVIGKDKAVFREHVNRADQKVFTMTKMGTSEVKYVGLPQEAGKGFEFMIARLNNVTRIAEWYPVSAITFEAVHNPSPELLTGTKPSPVKTDYSANFTGLDDYVAKRKSLTAEFGSHKKMKFLDGHTRRNVNDNALSATQSTTFTSPTKASTLLEHNMKTNGFKKSQFKRKSHFKH